MKFQVNLQPNKEQRIEVVSLLSKHELEVVSPQDKLMFYTNLSRAKVEF